MRALSPRKRNSIRSNPVNPIRSRGGMHQCKKEEYYGSFQPGGSSYNKQSSFSLLSTKTASPPGLAITKPKGLPIMSSSFKWSHRSSCLKPRLPPLSTGSMQLIHATCYLGKLRSLVTKTVLGRLITGDIPRSLFFTGYLCTNSRY